MTEAKERPTFRIVENPHPVKIDFDEFIRDFSNPYMTINDIKKKYDMTESIWQEYRAKGLEHLGIDRKPCYTYGKWAYVRGPNTASFIQKKPNGYIVVKTFGRNTKYYGRYADYDTAKLVRDKLVESDWDYKTGVMLMDKYSIHRKRIPALDRAKLIYPQFEELYFHSPKGIREILKDLGISRMVYSYLIQMIRKNHNVQSRPRSRV